MRTLSSHLQGKVHGIRDTPTPSPRRKGLPVDGVSIPLGNGSYVHEALKRCAVKPMLRGHMQTEVQK